MLYGARDTEAGNPRHATQPQNSLLDGAFFRADYHAISGVLWLRDRQAGERLPQSMIEPPQEEAPVAPLQPKLVVMHYDGAVFHMQKIAGTLRPAVEYSSAGCLRVAPEHRNPTRSRLPAD